MIGPGQIGEKDKKVTRRALGLWQGTLHLSLFLYSYILMSISNRAFSQGQGVKEYYFLLSKILIAK